MEASEETELSVVSAWNPDMARACASGKRSPEGRVRLSFVGFYEGLSIRALGKALKGFSDCFAMSSLQGLERVANRASRWGKLGGVSG